MSLMQRSISHKQVMGGSRFSAAEKIGQFARVIIVRVQKIQKYTCEMELDDMVSNKTRRHVSLLIEMINELGQVTAPMPFLSTSKQDIHTAEHPRQLDLLRLSLQRMVTEVVWKCTYVATLCQHVKHMEFTFKNYLRIFEAIDKHMHSIRDESPKRSYAKSTTGPPPPESWIGGNKRKRSVSSTEVFKKLPKTFSPIKKSWVYIKVNEAKNLHHREFNRKPNPYVCIIVDKEKYYMTNTIASTDTPVWSKDFHFSIPSTAKEIKLRVYDRGDAFDKCLGETTFRIRAQRTHKFSGFMDLVPRATSSKSGHRTMSASALKNLGASMTSLTSIKGLGRLNFTLQYEGQVVLPEECYDEIFEIFSSDSTVLLTLAELTEFDETPMRKAVLRSFITALHSKNLALGFLKDVVTKEINSSTSLSTVFRSSSAAVTSLSIFVLMRCEPLLRASIKPHIEAFCKKPKKLNYNDVLKDKAKTKRIDNLAAFVDKLWQSIIKSHNQVPPDVRELISWVRDSAANKWPAETTAEYVAASNLMFLRLFAPAIMAPYAFNMVEEPPSDLASAGLKHAAKILLLLANFRPLPNNDILLHKIHLFLSQNKRRMESYLDFPELNGSYECNRVGGRKIFKALTAANMNAANYKNLTDNTNSADPYLDAMVHVSSLLMRKLDTIKAMPPTNELTQLIKRVEALKVGVNKFPW